MKPTVQIQHSRTTTNLPPHERAARHRRSAASLPLTPKPTPPAVSRTRKTVHTRWSSVSRFGSTLV